MPTYVYSCTKGHVFEFWSRISQHKEKRKCRVRRCKKMAVQLLVPSWYRVAQRFDPVVIHVDGSGDVFFPGHTTAPVPQGYSRVELRTTEEVRTFERKMNVKLKSDHDCQEERRQRYFEEQREQNRRELRQAMQTMSARGRDFARLAMEKTDSRPKKNYNPEFHIEPFSFDSSNRPPYRDERTGWKPRY